MDTLEIDGYGVDTLMPDPVGHDRQPSAFLVFLLLWRRAGTEGAALPLREIAGGTGLSQRAVQSAIDRLERRRLVSVEREGITAVPRHRVQRPWARARRA